MDDQAAQLFTMFALMGLLAWSVIIPGDNE